ncbi:hypothetical protein [Allosphingosinicella sp.]|jgi:hypothetical protein|uniref:hypothetical protein n=1 Tax=Allosphingosinicella sp. TaxID=2823234 RepID=UPI002EE1D39F
MKLVRKLHNPFALVAQGFLAGAMLFLATNPGSGESLAASLAETAALVNDAAASL